jgi:NADP-dependent 3-hydroxy acid dehydrogenase YdfG
MRISITGHTKGVGLAISERLKYGNTIHGISRSTGFDLKLETHRLSAAIESFDSDIFVNNIKINQLDTFNEIIKMWSEIPEKTIVNISSRAAYLPENIPQYNEYAADKAALNDRAHRCQLDPNIKCRIINISPGYIGPNDLSHNELADYVLWAIRSPSHLEIGELLVYNRKSNDKFL